MSKKRNKKDEQILKEELEKALTQVFSPIAPLDSEDRAYLVALTYFRMHGHELRDEDLYEKGKKVGKVRKIDFNGQKVNIEVEFNKPLHFIVVNVDLKRLGEEDDEINKE